MALFSKGAVTLNEMLDRRISHQVSSNHYQDDLQPAKRRKWGIQDPETERGSSLERSGSESSLMSLNVYKEEVFNSEIDGELDEDHGEQARSFEKRPTELESALTPVNTDEEAIIEYELMRTAGEVIPTSLKERLNTGNWTKGKSSIYVDAFNLALETVLEAESHLFDEAETEVFNQWKALDYEAQYLYVRLFLRKTSAWHRISRLGYHGDIADIPAAANRLLVHRKLPRSIVERIISPGESIPPESYASAQTFTFADASELEISTLEEASSLLNLEELKLVAKEAKVQGKSKWDLLKALQRMSHQQSGLHWTVLKRDERKCKLGMSGGEDQAEQTAAILGHNGEIQSSDESLDQKNRDSHFIRKILSSVGPCIRLSIPALKLFERIHLVFYRSTEWTEKSLTTIILARISQRNFPLFIVSRSTNIFESRSVLLEFEAALRTQFRVDSLLESNGPPGQRGFDEILSIFDEVYPRWKSLLEIEQRKEDSIYESGEGSYLRRFSPAWVYTRILHKACYALGRLKMHERELQVLTELLDQHLFHASRRGAWYQRKALLEEHYMAAVKPMSSIGGAHQQKQYWRRISLRTCEQGLQDKDCHIIYHYDLQKRVRKLEKSLKLAKREQHDFGHVLLRQPKEVTVAGIRVQKEPAMPQRANLPDERKKSTKTVWIDEREGGSECSVESMCLSWYREQGWRGYHSEGGIIRTLFAYLFYDVLFAYIPNVFQTEYQTCPLDLHTDAFYSSRISEINHRLVEIANGNAERIICEVDSRERQKKTCVVGLNWDFELADLVQIVSCFKGTALATICKVMAQEYQQRGGGIPDLFLWHPERKEVMFSEVKSENDRLSDTQRLWIHVLIGAGIEVELCNAVAREVRIKREKAEGLDSFKQGNKGLNDPRGLK